MRRFLGTPWGANGRPPSRARFPLPPTSENAMAACAPRPSRSRYTCASRRYGLTPTNWLSYVRNGARSTFFSQKTSEISTDECPTCVCEPPGVMTKGRSHRPRALFQISKVITAVAAVCLLGTGGHVVNAEV